MANPKTGRTFICKYCGDEFYRRGSHIKRGITKSCGKPDCKSLAMSGENNPFWGKHHSKETKEALSKMKVPKKSKTSKYGPKNGTFTHTAKAKAAISEAMKRDWAVNRDKRLEMCRKSGETQRAKSANTEPRYRVVFTRRQKRDWKADACAWCDATDDLVLDHVIPVMAGGRNRQANAQTLCRKCNTWKAQYVDKPMTLATLDAQGASS